jgi:two-component system chemotaxis response regulator CheB
VIKLLVVDDSALMRRLLTDLFAAAEDFEVESARDGLEAIKKLSTFLPDVITLDIHMPGMDGLACLDRIMLERPTPVVMVSSLTAEGAEETLEAMALGAVDFCTKPTGAISLEMDSIGPPLLDKVRAAAGARLPRTYRLAERIRARRQTTRRAITEQKAPQSFQPVRMPNAGSEGLLLVGCSTGGPPALEALLQRMPAEFPWPVLVAQHMPASFTGPLAQRLNKMCALAVSEIRRTTVLAKGNVYIGRGDADLIVARRPAGLVALATPSSPEYHWHPSVDRLVASAMEHLAPEQIIGVLMTGMGSDGAKAMNELYNQGGITIAESEETAVIWGMPGALVKLNGASIVAQLDMIAGHLTNLVGSR